MKQSELISQFSSSINDGVILFDSRSVIWFANSSAHALLESEKNSLVGKAIDKVFDISIGDTQKQDNRKIVSYVFGKEKRFTIPQGKTLYFVSHSGRKFPVEISKACIEVDGQKEGMLIFRDITTEKKLENYKKNTTDILTKLVPVLQKTAEGDFSSQIELPEEDDEFMELLAGVQLMINDLAELSNRKDKIQKEEIQTIKEAEGELTKEVEDKTRELIKAKAHIETIIKNLSSGLIEYDSAFCIKRINTAAEDILGVKRQDIMDIKITPEYKDQEGKESLAVVSYPILARKGKRLSKEVFGKNVSVHELVIDFPLTRELEVITIPLVNSNTGERDGFIKMIRDITREKEISRSKSDFINIVAHQLRTPLSAVKWVLRMILDGDVGSLGSSQRKLLDKGYETNEKMIRLVNDLLNVARIEDDRFGYKFKEGNIVEVVTDVVDELRLMAEKGDIDLIFEKPDNIQPFVFDFSKIQLAFHNLLNNAIKYTRAGGTVRVSLEKDEEDIIAQVQDTGIGIPKKQINQMFKKFFRAENVIRLQVGGSGLGLFIVKDIIARHSGTITVKSIENEGTTFTLRIPIKHTIED